MVDPLLPRAPVPHLVIPSPRVVIPLPRPPQNTAAEWQRLVAPVRRPRTRHTRGVRWLPCSVRPA